MDLSLINQKLDRLFRLSSQQTSVRVELLAGITTFMTMAYILLVNPQILSNAIYLEQPQDLQGELVIATAIGAAVGSLMMGIFANYPFGLAPGMGLNAFFAFSVVQKLGIPWRLALAAVFIEGLIFIALTLSQVRNQIIQAIPNSLKQAIAAGIGLFIAYIGLSSANIIVASPITKTTLGNLQSPETGLAIAGLGITAVFMVRHIQGALLWGILVTAGLGWITGLAPAPTGIIAIPQWPTHLFGQALVGLDSLSWSTLGTFATVIFVFLFMDLFDTVGTLAGVSLQGGFINDKGELPRSTAAFMADALGTTVGALFGTSTVTAYIESAAGIAVGGRTGLTAIFVAGFFLLAMVFMPLFMAIPSFATAPALVIVGVLMMASVTDIDWQDMTEAIPAFLILIVIPLSYSITEGLAVGFVSYPILKLSQGKPREVHPLLWVLAVLFAIHFATGIGGM